MINDHERVCANDLENVGFINSRLLLNMWMTGLHMLDKYRAF